MQRSKTLGVLLLCLALATAGCSKPDENPMTLDNAAEEFVKLALAVGQHDADYVDAYFGPEEWRTAVEQFSDYVSEQTLATRLDLSPDWESADLAVHQATLGGATVRVGVARDTR